MPVYFYKAVANSGDVMEGEIEAPSHKLAIERLQSSGYLPISAEEVDGANHKQTTLFKGLLNKNKITHQDIVHITRELATLMTAGLPLDQSIQNLISLNKDVKIKNMLQDVQTRIQAGDMLSEALEAQGPVFDTLYISMIRAGEAGGAMDVILQRLADFMERGQALRSSTLSALIYPCILFAVASLSVFALLLFVVPQFTPLFEDAGQTLPFLTQVVFGIAELLRQFWWVLLVMFIVTVLTFEQQLKQQEKRLAWDRWILQLPFLGELLTKINVARFTRTLGTLLSNGVPLLAAIKIVKEVLTNQALHVSMDEVYSGLERGERLAGLLEANGQFPELTVQLIQVGEDSGQLESMLLKIADIYDDETKRSLERLLTMLEPALILGLGLIIAVIIISILMAMLGLNELVI